MEKQWKLRDFIFGGSKITSDGDCSHEIKRRLLPGRKFMTNLDSILKSRDITLPTKVHLVKDMVFPVVMYVAAATAKSLQSCPTLCDPVDSSPLGSAIPGILHARTLEWVAISFSNAWKWKVKVKSLSHIRLLATPWTATYQAPLSMGYSRQEYWSGVPLSSLTLSKHIYIIIPESTSLETTNLNLQAQIEKQWLKGTYA